MHVDPAAGGEIKISMDQEIPPIAPTKDTAQVKYLRVQNDRLTKFWGRPMHLGAIVLLPQGWDTHPERALSGPGPSRPFPGERGKRRLARDAARRRARAARSATTSRRPISSTRTGTGRTSRA